MRQDPRCWLAQFAPVRLAACDGRLDPCHLIPQALLKREFPLGVYESPTEGGWWPRRRDLPGDDLIRDGAVRFRSLDELLHDDRIIRIGCRHHHGALDVAKTLRIPRHRLPAGVEEFAAELGRPVLVFLDREYGMRAEAA